MIYELNCQRNRECSSTQSFYTARRNVLISSSRPGRHRVYKTVQKRLFVYNYNYPLPVMSKQSVQVVSISFVKTWYTIFLDYTNVLHIVL
jgi:hypothetical protein